MAEIPDSLPLSGPPTWQQHFTKTQISLIANVAGKVFTRQLADSFRTLGGMDERNQAHIRDLEAQVETLKRERREDKAAFDHKVDEFIKYAQKLETLFKENEVWRQSVFDAASSAHGDARTIERTIERLDRVIELVRPLVLLLEPFNAWLSKQIEKAHRLDDRVYSNRDGEDITNLVKDRRKR